MNKKYNCLNCDISFFSDDKKLICGVSLENVDGNALCSDQTQINVEYPLTAEWLEKKHGWDVFKVYPEMIEFMSSEEEGKRNKREMLVKLSLKELQHISKVLDRELKEVKRLDTFSSDEITERENLLNKISKVVGDIFDELYHGK